MMPHPRTVAAVLRRHARLRPQRLPRTWGDRYAEIASALSGDDVQLDTVELRLVELKKMGVITGRRMISLMGRHQREAGRETGA